jgi:hypothetical protein
VTPIATASCCIASKRIKTMQLLTGSLFIEDSSGNTREGKRGATLTHRIVVKNLGDRTAEVDIWIVATDSKSEPILRWCSFSERNPFSLEARESRDVTLTFEIPPQASPDLYNYEVLVDAQAQYPDKPPVRRPQQLRVLPSAQDGELGTDPVFTVKPVTTAAQPHSLSAGQSLTVTIQVKNVSKRVDRFYLTCPELHPSWFTVHYPESNLDLPGRVQETDGLELNPGSSGEIALTLHPPQHTPAGNYFPTLKLTSSNDDSLVLLDVVYLQILVSDRLDLQLQPTAQRLPADSGEFDLTLTNPGNVTRNVSIRATDPDRLFKYTVEPDVLILEPGTVESLSLNATPRQWWRRSWWGNGRELQFDVVLEEFYRDPAAGSQVIGSPTQGSILWQARPWWALALLVLASLGTIGAIAFLILSRTVFKPSPPLVQPQIVAVNNAIDPTTGSPQTYRADRGEAMRLDWTISRLSDIDRVTVIHLERGVEVDRKSYIFAGKIPIELQQRGQNGFCQPVKIAQTDGIHCQGMPATAAQAGTHTFQIQVFARDRQTPADSMTTDSVAIAPTPQPSILQFSPTAPAYQVPSAAQTNAAQNTGTQNTGAIAPPIRLNWDVSAPNQIQELQVIGVAADGSISSPLQRYSFENGLPTALQGLCRVGTRLSCRNVPTLATQAGNYTFQITLLSRAGQEIIKRTPLVRIQQTPQIRSLQLDGQEIGQTSNFRFDLPPNGEPKAIALSWHIDAGPGTRVDLIPAPGSVPTQGSITYTLSSLPGQQIVTLRITDPLGAQITRSIILETVAPPPAPAPVPAAPKPDAPSTPALPSEPAAKPPAAAPKPN